MPINQTRYVIIGGSAAGMAAGEAISELDPTGSVTILSEEPDMPYFRPMIPFIITKKKSSSEIFIGAKDPHATKGTQVRLKNQVKEIHDGDQRVIISKGEPIPYDKLLIATGSRPIIPADLDNTNAQGVFTLRTLTEARAISDRAVLTNEVVVLGGGLLGLKASLALHERGLKVTIIELEEELLPRLMDPEAGGMIHKALTEAGLEVKTGSKVNNILTGDEGVNGVVLDNGAELPCQMVCIAIGVQPNVEFLEKSGVQVKVGVETNDYTTTNVPNIYAAGDVAATFNSVTGETIIAATWTNAVEMGRCAGKNMAGHATVFQGTFDALNASEAADIPFVSIGMIHTEGTDNETHVRAHSRSYRKLVFSPNGEKLVGALFVGDISRAGLYRNLIREGTAVKEFKKSIIDHSLHYGHFIARA